MADHRADLFSEVASIDYPILDADAHVNEPPDTWQARVPAKLRERAPKVVHTDNGDMWSFDDGKSMRPVGLTATAGLSYLQYRPSGLAYDTMRPGSFDTKARLADMDADGIWLQVLYPSVTLGGAKVYGAEPELQLACVARVQRLGHRVLRGLGRAARRPRRSCRRPGVDVAIAETERAIALGHRGVVISAFPNGTLDAAPEDDRFWAFVQEADIPVAVHIGSFLKTVTGTAAARHPCLHGRRRREQGRLVHAARRVRPDLLRDLRAVPAREAAARRGEHRVDPDAARAGRRHVPAVPVVHQRRRADADDAEPYVPPELLGDVHGRHGRASSCGTG